MHTFRPTEYWFHPGCAVVCVCAFMVLEPGEFMQGRSMTSELVVHLLEIDMS